MGEAQTAIYQLATSRTGTIIAAGGFGKRVHLFDLASRSCVLSFDATFDTGGHRLAISNDGLTVVAGAYNRLGITACSGATGGVLWRRADLKKVQSIQFGAGDSTVLCGFDERPCECLNAVTGGSGTSLRGVRRAWQSPFSSARILVRNNDYVLANKSGVIHRIGKVGVSVLSAAFSPDIVCVSEQGRSARGICVETGAEVWCHTPTGGHFLDVAFCDELDAFVGKAWESVHRLSRSTGHSTVVMGVPERAGGVFCLRGTQLVQESGDVFDVIAGRQIGKLPFPLKVNAGSD